MKLTIAQDGAKNIQSNTFVKTKATEEEGQFTLLMLHKSASSTPGHDSFNKPSL